MSIGARQHQQPLNFCQHHQRAYGTDRQAPGEWFHLEAQLIFAGWGNEGHSGLAKWFLMDVGCYRLAVNRAGGIEKVGQFRQNQKYSAFSFYALPVHTLQACFLTDHRTWQGEAL